MNRAANPRGESKSGDKIRTFICIEIPDPIKARISDIQRRLRNTDAQVSWVRTENIHLTLKFLGDVPRSAIERVCRATEAAAETCGEFEITVSGAGCFPSPQNPRVLWIGLAALPESLRELHTRIEDLLARQGFPREQKRFSPHLTIGRVRSPRNAALVAEKLIAGGFAPASFTARECIVMRSELKSTGSVYTPQAVITLGSLHHIDKGGDQ